MNLNYDSNKEWNKVYSNDQMSFPCEYVIRIFKGEYPNLNLKIQILLAKNGH